MSDCQGMCEEHRGHVRKMWVHGFYIEPLDYFYCDEAVSHDRKLGFKVVEDNPRAEEDGDRPPGDVRSVHREIRRAYRGS